METLTQARLKEVVNYEPTSGVFTWLNPASNRVQRGAQAGHYKPNGYMRICIDGTKYYCHRLAWLYMTGDWPIHYIDHIDGDPSNNAFGNLRDIEQTGNTQNRRRGERGSSSRHLGVSWDKANRKWRAQIAINRKATYLGCFSTEAEAAAAYIKRKREMHAFGML